jgi:hypothetical protein
MQFCDVSKNSGVILGRGETELPMTQPSADPTRRSACESYDKFDDRDRRTMGPRDKPEDDTHNWSIIMGAGSQAHSNPLPRFPGNAVGFIRDLSRLS